MILELLVMTAFIIIATFFIDCALLFLAFYVLKQCLKPSNVLAWIQTKDPQTGASILGTILGVVKHSVAGMIGGSTPKRSGSSGGGMEGALQMLAALQSIGAAKKASKPEEPKV